MDSKKMFFSVDTTKMSVKTILKKEFLELSMRAVSSANPNANNTWFTPESLEDAIPSFYNKPILGYFENGDFVSHNGKWSEDSELGLQYWDTLGTKGERILGLIRSEDTVEVVQDEYGLSWINLTCALWTQYSYKQVKRLLKDAKRSQKFGGPTKAVSVEVDILDYDMLPNGVMKINKFNLVGITILGSQDGREVLPGIEGAELSVVEVLGTDNYAKQETELHLAYAKLNSSEIKEEDSVDKKEVEISEESQVYSEIQEESVPQEEHLICEEAKPEDKEEEQEPKSEGEPEVEQVEDSPVEKEIDDKEDEKDDEDPEEDSDDDKEDDDEHNDEEQEELGSESKCECDIELLQNECETYKQKCAALEQELSCKCDKCAEYEVKITEYEKLCEEQKCALAKYAHQEFLKDAYNIIYSSILNEDIKKSYFALCENGKYDNVDTLKKDVAFDVYNLTSKDKHNNNTSTEMPVLSPKVFSSNEDEAEKSSKGQTMWDRLSDNVRSK